MSSPGAPSPPISLGSTPRPDGMRGWARLPPLSCSARVPLNTMGRAVELGRNLDGASAPPGAYGHDPTLGIARGRLQARSAGAETSGLTTGRSARGPEPRGGWTDSATAIVTDYPPPDGPISPHPLPYPLPTRRSSILGAETCSLLRSWAGFWGRRRAPRCERRREGRGDSPSRVVRVSPGGAWARWRVISGKGA